MGFLSGSALLGGLLPAAAAKALTPKPPAPPPTVEMPDPEAQEKARKKALLEMMTRGGRASTILTDQGNQTLGG